MTKVIGVRFRTAGKIYFFSPGKLEVETGDKVIVETARGVEFGSVVTGPKEVEDKVKVRIRTGRCRAGAETDANDRHGSPAFRKTAVTGKGVDDREGSEVQR